MYRQDLCVCGRVSMFGKCGNARPHTSGIFFTIEPTMFATNQSDVEWIIDPDRCVWVQILFIV
ncbi:hypothetical protein JG687_00018937 [Phytophthora cactorum]|uniref:Uncharacterized protein n=1 Tax=Phytophthora cactorum TaxID=29920 RepID=A0A8T1TMJ3_9STRA|nr:hypothetical protein JG687_00018937 [Phytophthora cactorum]